MRAKETSTGPVHNVLKDNNNDAIPLTTWQIVLLAIVAIAVVVFASIAIAKCSITKEQLPKV